MPLGQGPYKWGLQVLANDTDGGTTYEWFKLNLYHSQHRQSDLERRYPSTAPPVTEAQCRKLVVDYLTAMKHNFDEFVQGQRLVALGGVPVQYIITVPAIWSESAKNLTRACAVAAGMGRNISDIRLIKEPEAAGIYALDNMRNLGLAVGDTFVLCDAGGG